MHPKTTAILLVALCTTLLAQAASESSAARDEHPWDPWLAALAGRVVDHAGEPVAGMRVEMLEADSSLLMRPEHTPLGRERLDVGVTHTDSRGRFMFEGAYPTALHALIFDGGGASASARFVDRTLAAGELIDLGDVVLAEVGTVIGTVVDEDGEPVAGARVRFGPVPTAILQSGWLDLRDDCVVALGVDTVNIVGVPPHAMALVERLPLSTALTGDDGSFRLTGVPLGRVTGGVDRPGFVATIVPSFELTAEMRDLGQIRLVAGRTLRGRVVDVLGEPVASAEVRAGALDPTSEIGILQPTGLTDDDGRFEITGIRKDGRVVACARRATGRAWWRGRADEGVAEVEVMVPPTAPLNVRVKDDMGEPLRGARITLRQWPPVMDVLTMAINLALDARGERPSFRVEETEPGTYAVHDVPLGYWFIRVESQGHALAVLEVEHESDTTVCEMVCAAGRHLSVTVTDGVSGDPIEGVCARIVRPAEMTFEGLAMGFSDYRGSVTLGPIPGTDDEFWETGSDAVLLVEHPLYAALAASLPDDSDVVDVRLWPTCTLTGTVTWGGGSPGAESMLMLVRDTEFVDRFEPESDTEVERPVRTPQFARTNADGTFRFTEVERGAYRLEVHERYLDADALLSILDTGGREAVHRVFVIVDREPGSTIDIALTETGEGPTTIFAGRVVIDGEPIVDATVEIDGPTWMRLTTDADGEFESKPLVAGSFYEITISGTAPGRDGVVRHRTIHNAWLEAESGSVTRIDLVLDYEPIVVEIVAAGTGLPIARATVTIGGSPRVMTDASGRVEVILDRSGAQMVYVTAEGCADFYGGRECNVAAAVPQVRVELVAAVPCAGRVVLPADRKGVPFDLLGVLVLGPNDAQYWADLSPEDLEFAFDRLGPGIYTATLWVDGREHEGNAIEIKLGPEGDANLVLVLK